MAYSPPTRAAAALRGIQVKAGRRDRGWTTAQLAERVGVAPATLGRVERGDPTVALGTVLEADQLVDVPLFTEDVKARPQIPAAATSHLALLPQRVRPRPHKIDDKLKARRSRHRGAYAP